MDELSDLFDKYFGKDFKNDFLEKFGIKFDDFMNDYDDSSLETDENSFIGDHIGKILGDSEIMETFEKDLGEPDEVIFFEENNVEFEKRIWNTDSGQIIHILSTSGIEIDFDEDFFKKHDIPYNNLQKQLEVAIEAEEYEEAARLRDLINNKKASETLENKDN